MSIRQLTFCRLAAIIFVLFFLWLLYQYDLHPPPHSTTGIPVATPKVKRIADEYRRTSVTKTNNNELSAIKVQVATSFSSMLLISGYVVNHRSRVVSGAEVTVWKEDAPEDWNITLGPLPRYFTSDPQITLLTDADGYFNCKLDSPLGTYSIRAEARDLGATTRRHVLPGEEVTLVLGGRSRVWGTVTGDCDLLEGFIALNMREFLEIVPVRAGQYEATGLPTGTCMVSVHSTQCELSQKTLYVEPTSTHRVDFLLTPGQTFAGKIIDAMACSPIGGARLTLVGCPLKTAVTDDNGEFQLGGIGGIAPVFFIEADHYAPRQVVLHRKMEENIIRLKSAYCTSGRVVTVGQVPIGEALVQVKQLFWDNNPARPASLHRRTVTSADGRFAFYGLRPDRGMALLIERSGYTSLLLTTNPIQDLVAQNTPDSLPAELGNIILDSPSKASFRLLGAEGTGVCGARIEVVPRNCLHITNDTSRHVEYRQDDWELIMERRTNSSGLSSFELPLGSYSCSINAEHYEPISFDFDLTAPATDFAIRLTEIELRYITINVQTAAGVPIPNADVTLLFWGEVVVGRTNVLGDAQLLCPGSAALRLIAYKSGFEGYDAKVDIKGAEPVHTIILKGGYTLEGKVRHLSEMRHEAHLWQGNTEIATVVPDEQGQFLFKEVGPGEYCLWYGTDSNDRLAQITVSVLSDDVLGLELK